MKKKIPQHEFSMSARAEIEAQREHKIATRLVAEGFLNRTLSRKNQRNSPAGEFYASREWASVRYAALLKADGRCACCGASRNEGAVMHVDHIKPRSKYPLLALVLDNLQVLCNLCNVAKSNIDMTKWRVTQSAGTPYTVLEEEDRRVFRVARSIAQDK